MSWCPLVDLLLAWSVGLLPARDPLHLNWRYLIGPLLPVCVGVPVLIVPEHAFPSSINSIWTR